MNEYSQFLQRKRIVDPSTGMDVATKDLNAKLYPFQRDLVRWALRKGRAALFCDCGMGKTAMQLEWARNIHGNVLILAPLAVATQTVREGEKFGIEVRYCREMAKVQPGITVTNYEMMERFDPSYFQGIVLDESSILKSYDGKFRMRIIESFKNTPFRLACTATPAPNDYMELGNHAEFLGVVSRTEMLSMFFVHDGGETQNWRLKGHAEDQFWRWLCSWAVMIRKPSNIGYEDGDFVLPPIRFHQNTVQRNAPSSGFLFPVEAQTLQERLAARRESMDERVALCAEIVNKKPGPWLVWCNLNSESEALTRSIRGAVEVTGSDDYESKESAMLDFSAGKIRVLVTKPSLAGFGMNWQHCAQIAYVGLSDSYEQFYQSVRRCWRFGQRNTVDVHIITAETEGAVVKNIARKEADAERMAENMVKHMAEIETSNVRGTVREKAEYATGSKEGKGWTMKLGDCVETLAQMPKDSVHYSVFSPPFASLYTYSNADRDMGNSKGAGEFMAHFQFLVKELARILMPGRLVSFHCMNLPMSKTNHGYIGIRDFRGDLIRAFEAEGFIYHSEVVIWKDPVTAMQRTKALGLLHKQIKKDSCMSRQGIPDYLVTMRKPGDNPERVRHTNEDFPVDLWQRYASPVWMDINPSDTLQFRLAREEKDERHICPLQIQVIERALKLWSNPGDLVLSPFAGIASEGYVAVREGRRFLGIELKKSYWQVGCENMAAAESGRAKDMFAREESPDPEPAPVA